jgi:hypothetical protein
MTTANDWAVRRTLEAGGVEFIDGNGPRTAWMFEAVIEIFRLHSVVVPGGTREVSRPASPMDRATLRSAINRRRPN